MMPELDIAINQREERMVTPHANVISGLDLCTALAHNDAASRYQLPIVAFHTQHLGVAIPAIAGATHTFFMCHDLFFLCLAFSIFNLPCAAAARCPCLCFWFIHLACSCLCLSWLSRCLNLFLGDLLILGAGSLTGNQALTIGHNIINGQDCQFLPVTTTMAIAFLRLVLENNQFFAAGLPGSGGKHHRILYQGSTYHRRIRIRDQQHVFQLQLRSGFYGKPVDFEGLADGHLVLSSTTFNDCKHSFFCSPFPCTIPIFRATLMVAHCPLSGLVPYPSPHLDSTGYVEGMGGAP